MTVVFQEDCEKWLYGWKNKMKLNLHVWVLCHLSVRLILEAVCETRQSEPEDAQEGWLKAEDEDQIQKD